MLLDPTNGLSDFSLRELRTVSSHTLMDDPSRVMKLMTLQARLGFQLDERTKAQYERAREAKIEESISPEALRREIVKIGEEFNPLPILETLEREGFLKLYFPAFSGAKLNAAGFQKLLKLRGMVPFGTHLKEDRFSLFMFTISEKWTPKEKLEFIKNCKLPKREADAWKNLESKTKGLGNTLKSAKLQKPSLIYAALVDAPAEYIFVLLSKSPLRLVQDRIKNYLQRHLPMAMEVTDDDVVEAGGVLGTPKAQAIRKQLIAAKLDARPKKVPMAETAYNPQAAV